MAQAKSAPASPFLLLTTNGELVRLMRDVSREFQKIQADALAKDFFAIVSSSSEETQAAAASAGCSHSAGPRPGGKTPNLDQFTINLTEKAKTGKIDPVLGRDLEIRQVVDILMRRRQNNPILTGEAGVGKTAVVEGFAHSSRRRRCSATASQRHHSHPRPGTLAGGSRDQR